MVEKNDLRLVFLLIAVITIAAYVVIFRLALQKGLSEHLDFVAPYSAARMIRAGAGRQLYDYDAQLQAQQEFFPNRRKPLLFNHPAFEALVFLPLASLSFNGAYLLWAGVNLALLLGALRLAFPYLRDLRQALHPGVMVVSIFSFFPAFVAVMQGQDSLLLLVTYAWFFVSLKKGQELRAGALLGLAMIRFHLVAAFLLPFVVRRRWKVLGGFFAALGALGLISVMLTGWEGPKQYLDLLWLMNQGARNATTPDDPFLIHANAMPNLRGFLSAQFGGVVPEIVLTAVLGILSLFLLGWSIRRGMGERRVEETGLDLPFALHATVVVLVSYHLHLHDASLLLLPIMLVGNYLARGEVPGVIARGRGLAGMTLALFLSPLYMVLLLLERRHLLALPILVLALLIAREIRRVKPETIGAGPR